MRPNSPTTAFAVAICSLVLAVCGITLGVTALATAPGTSSSSPPRFASLRNPELPSGGEEGAALTRKGTGEAAWACQPGQLCGTKETGCTKYASAEGSDSNGGTELAPYATINHLAQALSAGQKGCLIAGAKPVPTGNGGKIESVSGSAGNAITITSASSSENGWATVNAFSPQSNTKYMVFEHLKVEQVDAPPYTCYKEGNPSSGAKHYYHPYSYYEQGPHECSSKEESGTENVQAVVLGGEHNTLLENVITTHHTDICVETAGENNAVEYNYIHECGPPVTTARETNSETGFHDHGIYLHGTKTVVKHNIIVEASAKGIVLFGSGTEATIENNTIDRAMSGIQFGNTVKSTATKNILSNAISQNYEPTGHVGSVSALKWTWMVSAESASEDHFEKNCLWKGPWGGEENQAKEPTKKTEEPALTGVTQKENQYLTNPEYANPQPYLARGLAEAKAFYKAGNAECAGWGA